MSEEGKFRLNLAGNFALLLAMVGGAFALWTTIVQKYDSVDSKIQLMQMSLDKMEARAGALDALDKRVDGQGQQILVDEQRMMNTESKVDALTSLLNQFMGTMRSNTDNTNRLREPQATPTPTPLNPHNDH